MTLDRRQSLSVVLLVAGALAIVLSDRCASPIIGDQYIGRVPVLSSGSGDMQLGTEDAQSDKVGDLFLWHRVNYVPVPFGVFLLRDTVDWSYGSEHPGSGPPIKGAVSHAFEESRGLWADRLAATGTPDIAERLRSGRVDIYRPCWPSVLLALGLAIFGNGCAWALVPSRAKHRSARGECSGCGYPMTDLEDVPVCPECGRARYS